MPEALDPSALLDLVAIDRELGSRSLAHFVRLAWPVLEPKTPLVWGWHMEAVCQHVEAVLRGQLRRLLIAVPPGTSKSLISTVFGPAWQWGPGGQPAYRTLCASYSGTLSTRDSVRCRRLIESPWYQERWPLELTGDQNQKTRFENTATGLRSATSVGGTVTGDRGNLVACDDLLSASRAESEAYRKEASDFFWETLPTRLNDQRTDAFLVIAQRLHQADTIGEILDREPDEWEQLVLPMRFEPDRRAVTSLGFADPRTAEGELLDPERFPEEEVAKLETRLRHAAPGQLQQRPAPREGALIKVAWLAHRYRVRGDNPRRIVLSIDCASKVKERNDPTAAGVFAEFADRTELWHVETGRREFPALVRWAKDLAAAWCPTEVLIEDKDAGQQLIQQLRADTALPVIACQPGGLDKLTRMDAECGALEAGKLWLPESEPWVAAYVAELTTFPAATHDDQVDMTSQALKRIRENSVVRLMATPRMTRKRSNRGW